MVNENGIKSLFSITALEFKIKRVVSVQDGQPIITIVNRQLRINYTTNAVSTF